MFCQRNCLIGTIFVTGVLIALAGPLAYFWIPGGGRSVAEPPGPKSASADDAFFEKRIRPVLNGTCFKCHGGEEVKGDLRLDNRAALLKGGKHGPAVVPADAGKSLLIQVIRYEHEEIAMPPEQQLPAAVVGDFTAWVKAGAAWPDRLRLTAAGGGKKHWAFKPVKAVDPPGDPSGWSANPIDRFVRAKLEEHHLKPAGPADKRTLIRRVTFDLTGLPPAPAEVDAFLADDAADAYEKVVDRLLASPHYGERWGRHWLDVVRYGDSAGYEHDLLYADAWRYRDYVIRAFNAGKPFDRFLQEQVAGDELWPDDRDAVLATGLYAVGPALDESAMVTDQLDYEWLTDAADTTGAAMLGVTLGCARCHDHKYDPFTQQDYYGLQAVFAASDRPYPDKVRLTRIKALNGLLSDAPVPKDVLNDPRCTVKTEKETGLRLFHRSEPLTVHLLRRGELSKPRAAVGPAFPAALLPAEKRPDFAEVPSDKRRAALARWLTSPSNPLTARVLVNRVWGWHFGQAIVRTPNDFGAQGEPPTHPELLDWLARDFVDHGWDLKRLHRLILRTSTYRMASVAEGPVPAADPEDRLMWHYPRHRLEGEAIRDAILACAGSLNPKPFGPPVVPPLGAQELTGLFDAKQKWPVTPEAAEHTRRSVYLLARRTFTYPLFAAFDPPEAMTSCPQRARIIVPTQALTLLNSPLAREQSVVFARRLMKECGDKPEDAVGRAWQLAFGRPPTTRESEHALACLRAKNDSIQEATLADLCLALFNANEFIYVD